MSEHDPMLALRRVLEVSRFDKSVGDGALSEMLNEAVESLLRERLEMLLAMAKAERDAAPKADMLNDPYLYGQHMWFGGRVVGIVEALAELDGSE
jgi:hypothetical protein